jgi:hypothetical protein
MNVMSTEEFECICVIVSIPSEIIMIIQALFISLFIRMYHIM